MTGKEMARQGFCRDYLRTMDPERAARDNGLPFIGCQYGYLPHEVDGADIRVACAADIPRAVKALIGE